MNWSLGEIKSLSFKAARGAGLEWGQAEELSHCVFWLHQNGLRGIAALSGYLKWRQEANQYVKAADPILIAMRVCDEDTWENLIPDRVFQPLLLLYALSVLTKDTSFEVRWLSNCVLLQENRISLSVGDNLCADGIVDVSVSTTPHSHDKPDVAHRFECVSCRCVETLGAFAHRTYAPASEASRIAGAGAGNDAND